MPELKNNDGQYFFHLESPPREPDLRSMVEKSADTLALFVKERIIPREDARKPTVPEETFIAKEAELQNRVAEIYRETLEQTDKVLPQTNKESLIPREVQLADLAGRMAQIKTSGQLTGEFDTLYAEWVGQHYHGRPWKEVVPDSQDALRERIEYPTSQDVKSLAPGEFLPFLILDNGLKSKDPRLEGIKSGRRIILGIVKIDDGSVAVHAESCQAGFRGRRIPKGGSALPVPGGSSVIWHDRAGSSSLNDWFPAGSMWGEDSDDISDREQLACELFNAGLPVPFTDLAMREQPFTNLGPRAVGLMYGLDNKELRINAATIQIGDIPKPRPLPPERKIHYLEEKVITRTPNLLDMADSLGTKRILRTVIQKTSNVHSYPTILDREPINVMVQVSGQDVVQRKFFPEILGNKPKADVVLTGSSE